MDKENVVPQYVNSYSYLRLTELKKSRGRILSDVDVNAIEKPHKSFAKTSTPNLQKKPLANYTFAAPRSNAGRCLEVPRSNVPAIDGFNALPSIAKPKSLLQSTSKTIVSNASTIQATAYIKPRSQRSSVVTSSILMRKNIDMQVVCFNTKHLNDQRSQSGANRLTTSKLEDISKRVQKLTLSTKYYSILSNGKFIIGIF